MVSSQRVGEEISILQTKIAKLDEELAQIPTTLQKQKAEARSKAMEAFNQKKASRLTAIQQAVTKKREDVDRLLDTFPDLETKEFAGRYEVQELEDHLMDVYPPGMIQNYMCLNPITFDDDGEAYHTYSSVEETIIGMQQGNFSGSVFTTLSDILNQAADQPQIGMKVALFVVIGVGALMFFSPFLFLTLFTALGIGSAMQGLAVRRALRKLYSVKLYLNDAYDEDIFRANKQEIMASVDDFLDEARQSYTDIVSQMQFKFDESVLEELDKQADVERKRINAMKDLHNQQLLAKQKELEGLIEKLDLLEQEEKKRAELARKTFMGEVTWKKEWLENIFLDVTPANKVKVMPFTRGNSLYYSRDPEALKTLSRLVVFQCMIQMHPNLVSNYVLDYKYNGGELIQFVSVPERIIKIAYTEDDIEKRSSSINNDIRARTNNILGSCQTIEEYNKLMAEYGGTGEYYVLVHVFGLDSMPGAMLSNVRNGPRVGYFYKFYLTTDELESLGDDFPLTAMSDIYEVLDNPTPRSVGAVQRMLNG